MRTWKQTQRARYREIVAKARHDNGFRGAFGEAVAAIERGDVSGSFRVLGATGPIDESPVARILDTANEEG